MEEVVQVMKEPTGVKKTPVESAEEYRDRLRSIGYVKRVRSEVIKERVKNGEKIKEITDELGNTVTMRKNGQDVTIRPQTVRMTTTVRPVQ
jgi:hypothetical protein